MEPQIYTAAGERLASSITYKLRPFSDRSPTEWTTSELALVVSVIGFRGARAHPLMRREVHAYHLWLRELLAQRPGQL